MSKALIGVLLASGVLLSGCATLPDFNGPPGTSKLTGNTSTVPTPTVDSVIEHIQCEIWNLPRPGNDATKEFTALWANQYVVYAILTIDVTDNRQLSPSFDFFQPLKAASTSRSLTLAPQVGSVAHREVTQTFVLDLDPSGNPTFNPGKGPDGHDATLSQFCAGREGAGSGIKGDLGLKGVIAEGLRHADAKQFVFPLADDADKVSSLGVASSSVPSFSSTVDFTLTYGLNGSPSWTLTHFTGPTGGSGTPLSYLRTRKETLLIAFAAAQRRPLTPVSHHASPQNAAEAEEERKATAFDRGTAASVAAARESATITLLQRALPINP